MQTSVVLNLEILFNKCTGNSVEFKYLDPGVTILSGQGPLWPGNLVDKAQGGLEC